MRARWHKHGRKNATDSQPYCLESIRVYGFETNQVVLFAACWLTSCASACARSAVANRDRRRRGVRDHFAYGCTAGFGCICILGIVSLAVGSEYFDSRAIVWVGVAAGIGALGEEQHTLMRSMLLGLLQTLTKKQDEDKQ